MVPAITFRHCVPTATAALTAHLMADGRNVFVSSTLTVDFTYVTSSNSSDKTMEPAAELSREPEKVESFPVLLLALSPLHKIQRVRVMSSKKSGENMVQGDECNPSTDGASMEWQDVELNEETLTPVDGSVLRMISRGGAKQGVASYTAQDGCPQDVTPCKRRHSTGNDTFSDDGSDVLELVFSSSDSGDDKAPNEPSCVPELCQDGEEFVRCFTLKLLPPTTDAFGAVDGEFHSVHRCSVDIVLLPSEELAHVSYPQMFVSSLCDTVRPTSNTFQNSEADEVVCWDESSYVLLVGQRMYDCFICPRLAYADKIIPCVGYSSVDVNITAISLLENDDSKKWTAVSFSPLPLRPENLLCAFVQTKVATNSRCNVEIHGGVKWHVRYSAAFVHMAAADSGEAAVGPALPDMYFFGCDHANFQHILHMEKVAEAAWTAAVHCVTEDYPRTWVVSHTYEVNTLLGLRRGVLCTDRAALLSSDTLRASVAGGALNSPAISLRGKVAMLSASLEMRWRAAGALCQNVPEFIETWDTHCFASVNTALLRAWSICLLADDRGWSEFLRQERQIALHGASLTPPRGGLWSLPVQYAQEVYKSLLLLSSYFVVNALRHNQYRPWDLLRDGSTSPVIVQNDVCGTLVSTGMHPNLVRFLLRENIMKVNGTCGSSHLPFVRFVGTLSYEGKLLKQPRSGPASVLCHEVSTHLKPTRTDKVDGLSAPLFDRGIVDDTDWLIDLPFTVLCFSLEHPKITSSAPQKSDGVAPLPRCCVTQILPCCWRISGLDWACGIAQHSIFLVITNQERSAGDDTEAGVHHGEGGAAADDTEKEELSFHIPLLVFNPKVVPPSLFLRVEHTEFFNDILRLPDTRKQQAIIRHVMEEAVNEEHKELDEADMLFTPLLNQLLMGVCEASSCLPSTSEKPLTFALIDAALCAADVNEVDVWRRVYTDVRMRFFRSVSHHTNGVINKHSLKRLSGSSDELFACCESLRIATNLRNCIRIMREYLSSLHCDPLAVNSQVRRRPRLLSLKLRRGVAGGPNEDNGRQEKEIDDVPIWGLTDVALYVARVLDVSGGCITSKTFETRAAASSLVMPLWLPLLGNRFCDGSLAHGHSASMAAGQKILEALSKGFLPASVVGGDDPAGSAHHVAADALLRTAFECFASTTNSSGGSVIHDGVT